MNGLLDSERDRGREKVREIAREREIKIKIKK